VSRDDISIVAAVKEKERRNEKKGSVVNINIDSSIDIDR
jgi:multidrug resistance efflux pump